MEKTISDVVGDLFDPISKLMFLAEALNSTTGDMEFDYKVASGLGVIIKESTEVVENVRRDCGKM